MRESGNSFRTSLTVWSVEPSSTTTSSKSVRVCARTDRTALPIVISALSAGIMTENVGFIPAGKPSRASGGAARIALDLAFKGRPRVLIGALRPSVASAAAFSNRLSGTD